jgi:hypothetical protein
MVRRTNGKSSPAFLTLCLLIGPAAAFPVAENAAPEAQPSQTEPESKSYLPPWMQEQGSGDARNGHAAEGNKTVAETPGAGMDPDSEKKKAQASSQGQKSQRRPSRPGLFFPGLVGLFGR